MSNVELLHKLWLQIEGGRNVSRDHPKLGGFEVALRQLRAQESDTVYSYANISLSFTVETDFTVTRLFWSEYGVAILYVDLKSAQSGYASTNKKKKFIDMSATAGPSSALCTPVTVHTPMRE